jgi:hypothetical protein
MLKHGPIPAAVAVSAAGMERLPERHRKITGRSPVMPAAIRSATKASLR